jgi:hypothetical protein
MSVMAASAGAYVHLFTDLLQGGGLLLSFLGLGLAIGTVNRVCVNINFQTEMLIKIFFELERRYRQ